MADIKGWYTINRLGFFQECIFSLPDMRKLQWYYPKQNKGENTYNHQQMQGKKDLIENATHWHLFPIIKPGIKATSLIWEKGWNKNVSGKRCSTANITLNGETARAFPETQDFGSTASRQRSLHEVPTPVVRRKQEERGKNWKKCNSSTDHVIFYQENPKESTD